MEFTINGKKIVVVKVRQTGYSISDRIHFHATCEKELTREDIAMAQEDAGYHPAGYGLFHVAITRDATGLLWHADWSCAANCD